MAREKLIPLEIDRAIWGHNANASGGWLRNADGTQCCLGFAMRQCGFTKADVRKYGMPGSLATETAEHTVERRLKKYPLLGKLIERIEEGCGFDSSALSSAAADINDGAGRTAKEIEAELKDLFREHGVKVKFVGKAFKPKQVVL